MAGWYRRFIRNFAELAAPLTDTLKKGKFVMTEEAEKSVRTLKEALSASPVLRHPDFKRMFYVQCDASDTGVGAVLFQIELAGARPMPIGGP
ncbi:uncharacterized mitochondrial protein AtMg00860-like [Drosophila ananassae]|uniref:uncharacterized mitochondrial protein AtMg00860-like n=1 Tax=Drosophila ananassae TaxID=7217 RepID=UPI001CFF6661|nr:uncharacterized mitochondrial protein AtMg00860-like [Drosophila ananassae]